MDIIHPALTLIHRTVIVYPISDGIPSATSYNFYKIRCRKRL